MCSAWPAVSCSPGPGHQPRLQPEEPPCSCPQVPSPVSSPSYRLGYSFTGCREAELGSPRPREAKSHGGGPAGSPAHPGSDGFAEHSTVSPAKPSPPNWSTQPGPGGCFAFPGVEAFSKLCLVQIGSLIFQSRVYQECHKCCCRQQQAVSGRDQCVVPARNVSPQDSFALSF